MILHWPIKESFQRYVQGAAGTIATSDNVSVDGVNFLFPEAEISDSTWSFAGHGDMNAHGGFLAVIIADPIIEWDGANGMLSVRTGHDADDLRLDLALDEAARPWVDWQLPRKINGPVVLDRRGVVAARRQPVAGNDRSHRESPLTDHVPRPMRPGRPCHP